ncbi:MAG: hypothetical protein GC139_03690 [Sideroxydans sp.]|nr:hypothetical protein [Sideroxydans sp.]
MNRYEAYARAADKLRTGIIDGISDPVLFSDRVRRLYNRIVKSQLTVYQKERLLQLLDHVREMLADDQVATLTTGGQIGKAAAAKHRKSQLPGAWQRPGETIRI